MSSGTVTSLVPGASSPSPPDVPTHRLSPNAHRLSTACPMWPTEATLSSRVITESPWLVPTHTPSGAGARLSGLSVSNRRVRYVPRSILRTPRSHASHSARPLVTRRRPSTQANPSAPEPSTPVSAEKSAATQVIPRRSPAREAAATHTPPEPGATAPARAAIKPNESRSQSPVSASTRTSPMPSVPRKRSLRSGERAAAVKRWRRSCGSVRMSARIASARGTRSSAVRGSSG